MESRLCIQLSAEFRLISSKPNAKPGAAGGGNDQRWGTKSMENGRKPSRNGDRMGFLLILQHTYITYKWMKVGVYSPLTRSIYPPNTNLPIYLALGGPCRKKYHLSFQSLTTITGSMGISGTYSLEVPIPYICLAYVSGLDFREYPHKIWPYMVQFLHSRILKFPLTQ